MGDRQLRTQAAQAGVTALKPLFDALGDLAVAASAVGQAAAIRAAATRRAEAVLDAAEAEIDRRQKAYLDAWAAALVTGWTEPQLRADPIRLQPPARPRRRRKSSTPSFGPSMPTVSSGGVPLASPPTASAGGAAPTGRQQV